MIVLFVILAGFVFFAGFICWDFLRFARAKKKAEKPDGVLVDAGGVLFVQGKRTYYSMPNGVRRLIAGYPMDLTPGSPDMITFTNILENARRQKADDDRNKRKEALEFMQEAANGR